MWLKICALVLVVGLVPGCATSPGGSETWSEVYSDPSPNEMNRYPIRILAVDGRMRSFRTFLKIEPDFHYMKLRSLRPGRNHKLLEQPWALQAKPCIRYNISAQHDSTMSERWMVVVEDETRIAGCVLPASQGETAVPAF